MSDHDKYFSFQLRDQQRKAFIALTNFIQSGKNRVFILKGYAGTGKTTLLGGLVKYLRDEERLFMVLATTGRAAKILSEKTDVVANTIHRLIYVFSDLDDDLESISHNYNELGIDDKGQLSLIFDLKPIITSEEIIYIIDESSMISDQPDTGSSFAKFGSDNLLKDIFDYDKNGKFIFVGDPCQLPPINQPFSPALSAQYISYKYRMEASEFEMTDIVRQDSDSGIITASLKIRNLFYKNPAVKFASFPLKNHKNIAVLSSSAELLNQYIVTIQRKGIHHATFICQMNKYCSDFNQVIRSALFHGPTGLCKDDLLLVTQNNYTTGLFNGDLVQVTGIGEREYRCGISFLQVEVKEINSGKTYRNLLIEDVLQSGRTNLNKKQHKDLMVDYYKRMKARGISQKDPTFKELMNSDPYINALRCVYGYVLTCHKAQGGEWNEIYLYLDNKIHGIPKPGIYQWLYTAVTRSSKLLNVADDWFIK